MPHLTLEYTRNIPAFDTQAVLLQLNQALMASGQFQEPDLKTRAIRLDDFVIGLSDTARAFVHVKVSMLEGRATDTKVQLSKSLLQVIEQFFGSATSTETQLCVEIQEMQVSTYMRATLKG